MQHYRDEPGLLQSQADLQQYYDDTPHHGAGEIPMQGYGRGPGGYSQPLGADSQVDVTPKPNNAWLEKSATRSTSGRRKWFILGAVGIIALIAAGVAIAVVLVKRNQNNSTSSSSSSSSTNISSSESGSDPSVFTKDSRLVQSFYGIAYTPEGSQLPDCGNRIEDVITDIQLLSQLTKRIRLYGADCNQTELVLEAIKQTKVDMTVYLGNYVVATDDGVAYKRQRDVLSTAIEKYGAGNIGGVTVGNEFILNYLSANGGGSDPNSSEGNAGAQILIADIQDTKTTMSSMGLSNISIGTSDAGAYFNTEVLEAVAYGMANVHPWFADTTIQDSANWTLQFFSETNLAEASAVSNKPDMYIAETGWPTNSSTAEASTNGAATASEANLQIFMDDFVCQANAQGTKYFFFEYFDEVWKDIQYGGVEGYWGLFYANRTLKDITIPVCS